MEHTEAEEPDHMYKVVLVGETQVGKTALMSCYIKERMPKHDTSTTSAESAIKALRLDTGGTVKVQYWDTAGQERYREITATHYRRAAGALLVYDITQMNTFQNLGRWVGELRSAEPDIVIMLVGNKADLAEIHHGRREVNGVAARDWADRNGLLFIEMSVMKRHEVKTVFHVLVNEISKRRREWSESIA